MNMPYDLSSSYGDYCFEERDIIVERIHDDLPELKADVFDRVGGDGSVLRSAHLGERKIVLECRAYRTRWREFDKVKDEMAQLLMLDGEHVLSLRNHFGEYYLARLVAFSEDDRIGGTGIGQFTLTFTAYDPIRFGSKQIATVPSGGSVDIDVSGSYPTTFTVNTNVATRDSTTQLWGLRFDDGDFLYVKIPTNGTTPVSMDSYTRQVSVANQPSIVTLESNWPFLKAGTHTVSMAMGTGPATIEWQERNV